MAASKKKFLDAESMAVELGIPASTLKTLVKKGVLPQPVEITSGSKRMWTKRDIKGMAYMLEVIGAKRVRKSTPDEEDRDESTE